MPTFMCRWQNGDFSVVVAADRERAIELLDEVGNADDCELTRLTDFTVHFQLGDDGGFDTQSFGERTQGRIMEFGYPVLQKLFRNPAWADDSSEESRKRLAEAIKAEKDRLWPKEVQARKTQARTRLGRSIQAQTDAHSRMIDKIVEKPRN